MQSLRRTMHEDLRTIFASAFVQMYTLCARHLCTSCSSVCDTFVCVRYVRLMMMWGGLASPYQGLAGVLSTLL